MITEDWGEKEMCGRTFFYPNLHLQVHVVSTGRELNSMVIEAS